MKASNSSGNFRPFKDLQALLEEKAIELKSVTTPQPIESKKLDAIKVDRRSDGAIFEEAMADVKKISRSNLAVPSQTAFKYQNSDKKDLHQQPMPFLGWIQHLPQIGHQ